MVVAAYLPKEMINQTQKLVLMKLADSADDQSRVARPGLERMMAWAGVGEKQVVTVVTQLVGLGLVERVEVGRAGSRAEYRVFPYGVPPIPSSEELAERRRTARGAPRNPRLARPETTRRRPAAPARTQQDVTAREDARLARGGLPEGNPPRQASRVAPGEPSGFPWGDPKGSPRGTPSLPASSSPLPYPPTPRDGNPAEADAKPPRRPGCFRHKRPVANCRACGTNPRSGRQEARREVEEAARQSQREWLAEFLAEQRRRVAQADPEAVARARQQALEAARRPARRSNSAPP